MATSMEFSINAPLTEFEYPSDYKGFLYLIKRSLQLADESSDFQLCSKVNIQSKNNKYSIGEPLNALWSEPSELSEQSFCMQCAEYGIDIPSFNETEHERMTYSQMNKGQQNSAYIFEHCKLDRDAFISAFVMAALFECLEGRYKNSLGVIPNVSMSMQKAMFEIYDLSKQHVSYFHSEFPWDHKNTRVLPFDISWRGILFSNTEGLANFLAAQMSLMILKYKIFVPVNAEKPYEGFNNILRIRNNRHKENIAKLAKDHANFEKEINQSLEALEQQKEKDEHIYINQFNRVVVEIKLLINEDVPLPELFL